MPNIDFALNTEYIELHKLLKLTGVVDSGGAGKQIVASGDVKVDGKQELRKTAKIRGGQVVSLHGARIKVLPDPDLDQVSPDNGD